METDDSRIDLLEFVCFDVGVLKQGCLMGTQNIIGVFYLIFLMPFIYTENEWCYSGDSVN